MTRRDGLIVDIKAAERLAAEAAAEYLMLFVREGPGLKRLDGAMDRVCETTISYVEARRRLLAYDESKGDSQPTVWGTFAVRRDGTTPVITELATFTVPEDDGEGWFPDPVIPLPVKGGD